MNITFSKKPIVCFEDESVFKALAKMDKYKVKSLPVVDEKNKLKGVFSSSRILYDLKNPNEQTKVGAVKYKLTSIKSGEDEGKAISLMADSGFESIPIVEKDIVVGLISDYDILNKFKSTVLFKHMLATDLMVKGVLLDSEEPISKARELMNKNRTDSLAVYKKGTFFGVAIASKLITGFVGFPRIRQAGRGERTGFKVKNLSQPVESIVDKLIRPVGEFESLEMAITKMLRYNVGSLPVMKYNELLGVIRRIDIIKYLNQKLKSKDVLVNVSGKVDLEEAKSIINQIQTKVKAMGHIFKETQRINVYVKRSFVKNHFVVSISFDSPRHQFKREGTNLGKVVYDILESSEELFKKETNIKKSRKH